MKANDGRGSSTQFPKTIVGAMQGIGTDSLESYRERNVGCRSMREGVCDSGPHRAANLSTSRGAANGSYPAEQS
jgi:hypothetical protein